MATLLLTAGAAALTAGGAPGWILLANITAGIGGAVADNALFPPPDQKGPRLDGLRLGSAIEGSPIPFLLGEERPSCQSIFIGPVFEKEKKSGKGGPKSTSYTYSVDIGFGICAGPIHRVTRLWANGAEIYNADANVAISSNQIAIVRTVYVKWSSVTETNNTIVYMDLNSPAGGPDLSQIKSGKNATISGAAAGGNNGTFRVVSSSIDELTGVSTARLRNVNCVTASSGATIAIAQDLPEFDAALMSEAPTFYLGTDTQLPDPLYQSYRGVNRTPALRGLAWMMLHRLQVVDAVPQIQAEVELVDGTLTVADAITRLVALSPRPPEDFDTSGVLGNLRGMLVRDPQPIADSLRPITLAFDVLSQEDGGVLRFFSRVNAPRVEVEADELGAHEPGQTPPLPFEFAPVPRTNLPAIVSVTYADPTLDKQPAAQVYRSRRPTGASDNVVRMDLPIVLTPSEAQDIARRTYWTAHANVPVKFTLPPSRLDVQANDRIDAVVDGVEYSVLVTRVDTGMNGLLECEGVLEEDQTLTFTGSPAEDSNAPGSNVPTVPEMELEVIDLAPLKSVHENVPVIYISAAHADPSVQFRGAALFTSGNDDTYQQGTDIDVEATMGNVLNAPSSSGISASYWDRKSVLNVKLIHGELENESELAVLNGANRALWGREVIGFATVALQGDGSYNVSNILRGLADTDELLATHVAGEAFVLLNSAGVIALDVNSADIGTTRYAKAVATGGIVSQFDPDHFRIACNSLRHFKPGQLRSVRDTGTNDVVLAWTRRTRSVWRLLSTVTAPLLDTAEVYDVEILNDAETSVLRTITVTSATTTTYTSAQQTADFGGAHANVHWRVYQRSSIVGRSKASAHVAA